MAGITLNTNVAALAARRRLAENTAGLRQVYDRLASGLRIARAADDAAGLSVAASLDADARVYAEAVRNVNDGLSYLNIAEGATGELKGVLTRLRELSTQSSNGVYTDAQRQALDREFQALVQEYNRILDATSFNGRKIFEDTNQELTVQAGYGSKGQLTAQLGTRQYKANGTFMAASSSSTGVTPYNHAVGDVNGDGIPDVVLAGGLYPNVSIMLGAGDGSFAAPISVNGGGTVPGNSLYFVALGDLNGDGRPDLVTGAPDGSFNVLIGNGDGTFQSPVSYNTGLLGQQSGVQVVDLNGDGKRDVISTSDGFINVFLGNGDGTLNPRSSFALDADGKDLAVGDLNGDGKLDVAAATYHGGTINVLLGNGDGSFQAASTFSGGNHPSGLSLADINGDGRLDIINGENFGLAIDVRLGNGDGTFQPATVQSTSGGTLDRPIAGDLNADGHLDVVVATDGNTVDVFFGNGDGTVQPRTAYAMGNFTWFADLVDLNRDGVLDIMGGVRYELAVMLGQGSTEGRSLGRIGGISVATQDSALAAQGAIDGYLDDVNAVSGLLGSAMSRFEAAMSNLQLGAASFRDAEARIRDADVAEESARLVRSQILQRAGTAVLARANQESAMALRLLA